MSHRKAFCHAIELVLNARRVSCKNRKNMSHRKAFCHAKKLALNAHGVSFKKKEKHESPQLILPHYRIGIERSQSRF